MNASPDEPPPMPVSMACRLDQVCDRFEEAWLAGLQPHAEESLDAVPEAERPALLRDLLRVEVEYRRRQGERPETAEYQARFPTLDPAWLAALSLEGHGAPVNSLAFSPDGRDLASASDDGTVRLWDLSTGKERFCLTAHRPFHVWAVAFSPDGQRLASSSGPNPNDDVRLWDTATGRELLTLSGHKNVAHGLAFSPDDRRLATASLDGTIKLWDTGDGRELLTLRGQGAAVYAVAFSGDGLRLASAGRNGTVKIWDGPRSPTP